MTARGIAKPQREVIEGVREGDLGQLPSAVSVTPATAADAVTAARWRIAPPKSAIPVIARPAARNC